MKAMMQLFSMVGACPDSRAFFVHKMQNQALAEMEESEAAAKKANKRELKVRTPTTISWF